MHRGFITIGVYMAVFMAVLDQVSKWWVLNIVMDPPRTIAIMPHLNVTLSWNNGVTFGFLSQETDMQPYILAGLALIICAVLVKWLWEVGTLKAALGLGSVLGGAIGNITDRLQHGAVVDFIDVYAFDYHWYTFNIADSAIVLGVGLLLLDHLVMTLKKE